MNTENIIKESFFKEICAEYIVKNLVNYNWEYTDNEFSYISEDFDYSKINNNPGYNYSYFRVIYLNKNIEIDFYFWKELVLEDLNEFGKEFYDETKPVPSNSDEYILDIKTTLSVFHSDECDLYQKMKSIIDLDNYPEYSDLLNDKENIFTIFDINFLPCQKIDKYYGINKNSCW